MREVAIVVARPGELTERVQIALSRAPRAMDDSMLYFRVWLAVDREIGDGFEANFSHWFSGFFTMGGFVAIYHTHVFIGIWLLLAAALLFGKGIQQSRRSHVDRRQIDKAHLAVESLEKEWDVKGLASWLGSSLPILEVQLTHDTGSDFRDIISKRVTAIRGCLLLGRGQADESIYSRLPTRRALGGRSEKASTILQGDCFLSEAGGIH